MSDPKNDPEKISEIDAEIVSDAPQDEVSDDDDDVVVQPEPTIEDAEIVAENAADEVEPDGSDASEADGSVDTPAAEPAPTQKSGFMPLVLGGVVAAAIGAAGALYVFPQGLGGSDTQALAQLTADLKAQAAETARLQAALDKIILPPDLTAEVGQALTAAEEATTQSEELRAALDSFGAKLSVLEKRPVTEAVSADVVAAYEAELQALQQAMSEQRKEVEAMVAEAEAKRGDADEIAKIAAMRNALTRVQAAVASGASFGAPIDDLRAAGAEIPAVLLQNAQGVPSLRALEDTFPALARKALSAARSTETDRGVATFLRDQLGVRSLTPQEGDDADAILSRAEAALASGHLSDALAELETLPEIARVELSDWLQSANLRLEAQSALAVLSQQVMTN
ncbi:MAG: hypothetical protein JXR13_15320 [Thalassovita sp.]